MSFTRCTRCLIPSHRPDTHFTDGVCSACLSYERRPSIDWAERKSELVRILETAPRNGSGYDCIVPSSGGKDSAAQTIALLELGAKPLLVTASTCHLSPIGRINIDNLARYAPTLEVTPNMSVRRKLNKIGMTMVGDPSWPEHVAIHRVPFRVACELGIPLLFYGENPLNQYGSPPGMEEAKTMTQRWVSEFGGFLGLRPSDIVGIDGITENDMKYYEAPSDEQLKKHGVTAYFLGQFMPWDSHRNAEVAEAAGMVQERPSPANWWKAENLDNAQCGLHCHFMYRKFGYGRLCAQISVDIRMGKITREEAYPIVRARDGAYPQIYANVSMAEILRRIGMNSGELVKCMDQFTNWELFDREENARPILKEFA